MERSAQAPMTADQMVAQCNKYTFWSWSAQGAVNPIPMVRAAGIHFWDADGKRYIDMNSQLMCCNIGHGNQRVIDAIKEQAQELAYAGPGMATRIRAEIGPLLARHTPGDLDTFFFTLGGAESNENAIKLARQYTGRQKIITRYRSYHGATAGAMTLTGDPRRWANEPGLPGVIRAFDPYEYRCSFGQKSCSSCRMLCLSHIEEMIMYEGPNNIAAVFIESVTGTNGLIVPPDGYLQGLRAMCDKYDILLICDEVMAGLGRTGAWFAVDNWRVTPDIITMAKGLTSAYMPLGCVAMSGRIAEHFNKNVFYGGLTYNAHPMCLAAAAATLRVLEEDDLIGNAQRMGNVMAELLQRLKAKHPSVGDVRSIGLFGVLELVRNRETREPLAPFNGSSPAMACLGAFFKEQGLAAFIHWNNVFTNPPLIITEEQLREAFDIIDRGLEITDQVVVGA
jgi:taurine---2-oxoglutarate transaminase